MNKDEKPTRERSTQLRYAKEYASIQRRVTDYPGMTAADWLVHKAPTLSRATVNLYRAAIIAAEGDDHITVGKLKEAYFKARKGVTGKTSSTKAKRLKPAVWEEVLGMLVREPAGSAARIAAEWISVGTLTGLRPCEWPGAMVRGATDVPVLEVVNRKATNGRAFAFTRQISLAGMTPTQVAQVREWTDYAHANTEQWDRIYRSASQALKRAVNRLRPRPVKRITLYTGRHQMSADAKAAGLGKSAVAALMGQASIETAGRHYGKKRYGRPGHLVIKPAEGDVARVAQLNTHRIDPRERRAAAMLALATKMKADPNG